MTLRRLLAVTAASAALTAGSAPALAQASSPANGTYYAIGDSISNDAYDAQQFGQFVAGAFPGLTLENLAVAGSSAAFALDKEVTKIPAGDPGCKLVTIETGINDVVLLGTPPATVESEFAQIYQAVRQRCPRATIAVATYVNNAVRPDVRAALDGYNQWLREFAAQNRVPLADLAADRRFNDPPFPSALMRNWMHPSTDGNRIVGQDFIDAINAVPGP